MRVGILDIGAAGVALFAVLLPPRSQPVEPVYVGEAAALSRPIAEAQAQLVRDPSSGEAAESLTELLLEAGETDWALRVASTAAERSQASDRWRALLAVSAVHADRLEIEPAWKWAEKALGACNAPGAACAPHDRVRLETYVIALKAGVDSGVDPRLDPKAFDDAIKRKLPTIQVRPPKKR